MYVVLWEAGLSESELRRWLISYWCFYHVGTASWAVDGGGAYWDRMREAAGSKVYPRSAERRHFRGENARKSVEYLYSRGSYGLWLDVLQAGPTAADVVTAVQQWQGFGPWIAFKVADMVERLGIRPVRFDLATAMYDAPREGAELLYNSEGKPGSKYTEVPEWAVGRILDELRFDTPTVRGDPKTTGTFSFSGATMAPPRYERQINVQEAETILCKWKSYMNGRYHVGEDVAAVRKGLLRFPRCAMSQRLIQAGKKGGLW